MISIRKTLFVAAVMLGAAGTDSAQAQNGARPCNGPFCNQPRYPTFGNYLFGSHQKSLPTFQAAPWYMYWPYDAHFLTPAPVTAPFYAPPGPGNFPANPYFPSPGGYYGPMPGGPAPGGIPFGGGGIGSYPPAGMGGPGYPGGPGGFPGPMPPR